jgi:hypothetical protein
MNIYLEMNPDELIDQAEKCIEIMCSDKEFNKRYRSFCDMFVALTIMTNSLVDIARKNFKDKTWNPPLHVVKK